MKVVIASNYLNHHQLPLCLAMVDHVGADNFRFIASTPFNRQRLAVGYADMNHAYDWVVCAYEGDASAWYAKVLVEEADIAILNPGLTAYASMRAAAGKQTFFASERILKRGYWWRFAPPKLKRTYKWFLRYRDLPFYVLCSSAYASYDFKASGFPAEKCFNWAYFTAVSDQCPPIAKRSRPHVLWVGRMLGWKHPLDLARAAHHLAIRGVEFDLEFIGEGEELPALRSFISDYRLQDRVTATGSLPNDEVRRRMADADIFVTTSDQREGWGAVVGEAMSFACAVVASDAMGSVPTLIDDGVNGLIYHSGDVGDLARKLEKLICDIAYRTQLREAAFVTMSETWNAEVAASRLLELADALAKGDTSPFESGPCSWAQPMRLRRFR